MSICNCGYFQCSLCVPHLKKECAINPFREISAYGHCKATSVLSAQDVNVTQLSQGTTSIFLRSKIFILNEGEGHFIPLPRR
jgi:hypothetical protein